MPTLYQLSAEAERIAEMMERTDGDDALMTTADVEANEAFIEGLRTEADGKADGYARAIREHEARATARRAEAKAMAELAASAERSAESLKRFVLMCMERLGTKQLGDTGLRLCAQANGGKQPVDVFIEIEKIPARFVRTKVEADRDLIRDALLRGDLEAAKIATLQPRGVSLRIK